MSDLLKGELLELRSAWRRGELTMNEFLAELDALRAEMSALVAS